MRDCKPMVLTARTCLTHLFIASISKGHAYVYGQSRSKLFGDPDGLVVQYIGTLVQNWSWALKRTKLFDTNSVTSIDVIIFISPSPFAHHIFPRYMPRFFK